MKLDISLCSATTVVRKVEVAVRYLRVRHNAYGGIPGYTVVITDWCPVPDMAPKEILDK